jgi:hypothetical protein
VPLLLWPGCHAYVDLNTMLVFSFFLTDALGISHTPFAIPNAPSLVGFPFTAQGLFLGTSDPFGIRATDGLYLILGN